MKKLRRFIYSLFPSVYFVVSLRYKDGEEHSRNWGFYFSKKTAFKVVENNMTDIAENGYYPFVVVQKTREGLLSNYNNTDEDVLENCFFFAYNSEKDRFDRIEGIPAEVRQYHEENHVFYDFM